MITPGIKLLFPRDTETATVENDQTISERDKPSTVAHNSLRIVTAASPSRVAATLPIKELLAKPLTPWKPRYLPLEAALEKMVKNAKKALIDHRFSKNIPPSWLPSQEAIQSAVVLPKPLTLTASVSEAIGCRKTMQDRSFITTLSDAKTLAAIFDGHRSDKVAEYLKCNFETQFSTSLTKVKGNIHQAFEETIQELQNQIVEKKIDGGAAAVICYIDPFLGIIYTATVGDSEAMIFRIKDGITLPIPLSPLRNWTTKKEQQRAQEICGKEFHLKNATSKKPKVIRGYVSDKGGINLSRSLGNRDLITSDKKMLLSIKPEISVHLLYPGDTVILCSDGIPDSLSIDEMIKGCDPKYADALRKPDVRLEKLTKYSTKYFLDFYTYQLLITYLKNEDYKSIDTLLNKEVEDLILTEEEAEILKSSLKKKAGIPSGKSEAELLVDYAANVKFAFDNVTACVIKIT